MGKKVFKKPLSNFFSWSAEEQAKYIESETQAVIKRLPKLKSALQMYGEVSDELYNMSSEELSLIGTTYARAVRSGEITTSSSKNAYRDFINKLRRYARTPINELAIQTAQQRIESWLANVRNNASKGEIEYAEYLLSQLSEEDKLKFTRSKYFLDTENWSSDGFMIETEDGMMSIQVLKLELFCDENGYQTKGIYLNEVSDGKTTTSELRGYTRHRKKKG